ncbi:MAG: pilus assembly protein TadG-related protein [Kineosporiaceae bacterium]
MPTALLLLVVLVVLGLVVLFTLPLGAATDQKTRSRTAADAAALAGAHAAREEWVYLLSAPGTFAFPTVPGIAASAGGGPAGDYAGRHQAVLTGYQLRGDGTVYSRVRNTDDTDRLDGQAESDATAALPISFDACEWDNTSPPLVSREELEEARSGPAGQRDTDGDELPDGEDGDLDDDGIPNGEDPDADGDGVSNGDEDAFGEELVLDPRPTSFVRTLVCGPWRASYVIDNIAGVYPTVAYAGGETPELLIEALEPRLID